LSNDGVFVDFASTVLGPSPTAEATARLRQAVSDWHLPYHIFMQATLPTPPWGPARSDGLGLNFNRITGLDIGPPPTYVIRENIRRATAPVRYPFLWNSPVQDKTEWAGFTDNGNDILALGRNMGEVFGVFAVFHPTKDGRRPFGIDYLANNSANIPNLKRLEDLVKKLGPARWPWAVDQTLASAGKAIFARNSAQGGCVECHGISPGRTRLLHRATGATPVLDVGTDTKQYDELDWTAQTGVLSGARIPLLASRPEPNDKSNNVQTLAVTGSILQYYVPLKLPFAVTAQRQAPPPSTPPAMRGYAQQLEGVFHKVPPRNAYEARVLQGIWAAAPYLHNGSVPSLAELLKPAAERVGAFRVGPAYDTVNVGLAAEQSVFNYTLQTTDCGDRNSGNSRCGHEYGSQLMPAEKRALLEYLKTL
jgi:hypothetical protein